MKKQCFQGLYVFYIKYKINVKKYRVDLKIGKKL